MKYSNLTANAIEIIEGSPSLMIFVPLITDVTWKNSETSNILSQWELQKKRNCHKDFFLSILLFMYQCKKKMLNHSLDIDCDYKFTSKIDFLLDFNAQTVIRFALTLILSLLFMKLQQKNSKKTFMAFQFNAHTVIQRFLPTFFLTFHEPSKKNSFMKLQKKFQWQSQNKTRLSRK